MCLRSESWGYSSAGRALEWHSRGHRFDPGYLHQKDLKSKDFRSFFRLKSAVFVVSLKRRADDPGQGGIILNILNVGLYSKINVLYFRQLLLYGGWFLWGVGEANK